MTKDDIITLPNKHLRERSKRVGYITNDIKNIINDMISATIDWDESRDHEVGVALAAAQIDKLLRIIIVRNNYEDKNDKTFTAFINPEVIKKEGEIIIDFEGCLSVPNIYGKVPRYTKVKVKALDENGKVFRITADGFMARILQHEIDHIKGTLFIDHIKDDEQAFYILQEDGTMSQLDYEKDVRNNNILW